MGISHVTNVWQPFCNLNGGGIAGRQMVDDFVWNDTFCGIGFWSPKIISPSAAIAPPAILTKYV